MLNFIVDHLDTFFSQEAFHGIGAFEMMLAREQTRTIYYTVGGHPLRASMHGPPYHARGLQ